MPTLDCAAPNGAPSTGIRVPRRYAWLTRPSAQGRKWLNPTSAATAALLAYLKVDHLARGAMGVWWGCPSGLQGLCAPVRALHTCPTASSKFVEH